MTTTHPWLSRIPAPVGSQEVVEHTHKLALTQCSKIQEIACMHIPIVWGVKALENSITSCNPTGAGILDNPDIECSFVFFQVRFTTRTMMGVMDMMRPPGAMDFNPRPL